MALNCENCKYHNISYEWDDSMGDEAESECCSKGHNFFLKFPIRCPHFKKYIPKPYVEKDTECDKCQYVQWCAENGYVINSTTGFDTREHFIHGRSCKCRKEDELLGGRKLSELLSVIGNSEIIQKAIEKFGDITYEELMNEKIYELEL